MLLHGLFASPRLPGVAGRSPTLLRAGGVAEAGLALLAAAGEASVTRAPGPAPSRRARAMIVVDS